MRKTSRAAHPALRLRFQVSPCSRPSCLVSVAGKASETGFTLLDSRTVPLPHRRSGLFRCLTGCSALMLRTVPLPHRMFSLDCSGLFRCLTGCSALTLRTVPPVLTARTVSPSDRFRCPPVAFPLSNRPTPVRTRQRATRGKRDRFRAQSDPARSLHWLGRLRSLGWSYPRGPLLHAQRAKNIASSCT